LLRAVSSPVVPSALRVEHDRAALGSPFVEGGPSGATGGAPPRAKCLAHSVAA